MDRYIINPERGAPVCYQIYFYKLAAQFAAGFKLDVAGGLAADDALAHERDVRAAAVLFPGAHPFAVAPAVGAEERRALPTNCFLQEENIGSKTSSSRTSEPMAGQPSATASSPARSAALTASALRSGKPRLRASSYLGNGVCHGLGIAGAAPVITAAFS